MLYFERPSDLESYVGQKLGVSDWILVDQVLINKFADATGDRNWFHVDPERARREIPEGKTIAHGCLTYALVAKMSESIYEIRQRKTGANYGVNRLRFTSPVFAGSRIRLHETLTAAEPIRGGMRLVCEWVVEIEGQEKPAMVGEGIVLAYG